MSAARYTLFKTNTKTIDLHLPLKYWYGIFALMIFQIISLMGTGTIQGITLLYIWGALFFIFVLGGFLTIAERWQDE